MYGVVDVDVDIVQKIVTLVPVSAPFALKTLEVIRYNDRIAPHCDLRVYTKKYVKIIFHKRLHYLLNRLNRRRCSILITEAAT